MYYLWMTYVLCLFLNVLGNMAFWIAASKDEAGAGDAPKDFGLSIIWLVIYSPCSMCWYIPAYRAFKTDSSFNFFIFFFVFFFQVRYRSEPFFYFFTDNFRFVGYSWWQLVSRVWDFVAGSFRFKLFQNQSDLELFLWLLQLHSGYKKKEVKNCVLFW